MTVTYHLSDVEYAQYTATGLIVVDGEPCKPGCENCNDGDCWLPPEFWRKLTEPCPTCAGSGVKGISSTENLDCPECVGGRRVVALTATRSTDHPVLDLLISGGYSLLERKVTLGRFTIRLLPIVEHGTEWLLVDVVASGLMNGKPLTRLWRWNGNASQYGVDAWGFGEDFTLAHLPQSGQWAIQFEAVK